MSQLIITIIIPKIPREWKYNTSIKHFQYQDSEGHMTVLKTIIFKKDTEKNSKQKLKIQWVAKKIDIPCPQPDLKMKQSTQ